MDGRSFDDFTRAVTTTRSPRRSLVRGVAVGLLGSLLPVRRSSLAAPEAAACVNPGQRCEPGDRCCDGRCRGRRCRCRRGRRPCGRRCIPAGNCCTTKNCGTNERCVAGVCEPCLAQGVDCTEDAQCCTGICDRYTDKCQQVRVSCDTDDQCPYGRCCDGDCVYERATQRECEPETECGYLLCATSCDQYPGGNYEYCGFDGSAACRRGRCCCPPGIPRVDCPDIQNGGLLPRCP